MSVIVNISFCLHICVDYTIFRFLYGDQARFFGDEIRLDLKHSKMGTVAMASAGEDLNASQVLLLLLNVLTEKEGKS